MKYNLRVTNRFKKDLKTAIKRGYNIALLDTVVNTLQSGDPLEEKYRDHPLSGNWEGFRECHITPDWLLVYEIDEGVLVLALNRTGTHSDLF